MLFLQKVIFTITALNEIQILPKILHFYNTKLGEIGKRTDEIEFGL